MCNNLQCPPLGSSLHEPSRAGLPSPRLELPQRMYYYHNGPIEGVTVGQWRPRSDFDNP